MALLEMGANVETNGYPSRCYSTRNFIFGSDSSTWTSSNGKAKLSIDCHRNRSLLVPSPAHIFEYDKELLKQTMLKHEAMFKDQIHELHRLYQKQRELMDQLRVNELYKHNLRTEISWSGALSHVSSKNAPRVCCLPTLAPAAGELALAAGESSVLVAESIPLPWGSVQEKRRQLCPAPSPGTTIVEGFFKDSEPSKSNYRKAGKNFLDLELPADEYVDCEEGESLEDTWVSKVAAVSAYTLNVIDTDNTFAWSEPLNKKPKQVSDLPGFQSSDQINQGLWSKEKNSGGESSTPTQDPTRDGLSLGPGSAQLVSEGVEDPKNTSLNVTPAFCSETTAFQGIWVNNNNKEDKFQDSRQGLPLLPEKPVPKRQLNGEESKISTQKEPVILKHYLGGIHGFEIKKVEGSDLCGEKIIVFPVNGKPHTFIDLHSCHSSPSDVCQIRSENQNMEDIGRDHVLGVNISCELPNLGGQIHDGEHHMENEIENKHKCLTGIDLNSCLNDDEDMPVDVHFQAPENLENNECSLPTGESIEKQLEMPYPSAGQEDSEVQKHQSRIAAEALVSISAFAAPNDPQMSNSPPSESFTYSPLRWFASIVSSIKDQPGNEVKVDCSGKTDDDLGAFLTAGIDYFEAMTLRLTGTENIDCCCNKFTDQNEKEGGATSLSLPRKGQSTKRGRQRRDFQSEILPSLAALSRYELTEDLQTIEGLMEAAGTHLEAVSRRNAGRGRKCFQASGFNVADSLLNHLTDETDLGIKKRDLLMSWGKTCKRRGQRYPTSNPQFFVCQVYD